MGYNLHLNRRRLDNGLTLLVSENRHLPLVTIVACVLAGSDQNPPHKEGLAELTSRLLDEGSTLRSAEQISADIENEGGRLSITSLREWTSVLYQARRESLTTGLDVFAELLRDPAFPADRLEQERQKQLSDLDGLEDDPRSLAAILFNRVVYEGTPFSTPLFGTAASLSALRREDVVEFHETRYGPRNTILVVVGDVDSPAVEAQVERALGSWRRDLRRRTVKTLRRQTEPRRLVRHADGEQLQIALGHLGIDRKDPDFYRLQVLDLILGSGPGFTSRIPRVLRDEMGLVYDAFCSISGAAGLYPGSFLAFASTSPENREEVLEQLHTQIAQIVAGKFTDEELETAQDFLTGNFVFDFESNYNVARFLLSTELFGLGLDYLDRYPDVIRSVRRRDIVEAAGRHLDTVNCTTVEVGPLPERS